MKSYKEHLKSVKSYGEEMNLLAKPVYRSSAIFPVMESNDINSKISFLGYWLKKRNINQISILLTLRDNIGEVIFRSEKTINTVKAFSISIKDLNCNIKEELFTGSLELEVFSVVDMVFPYPAFIVEYISNKGTTVVHTTGRVYNDIEDYINNSKIKVAESGFDVYSEDEYNPFFSFTNGPYANNGEIKVEIFNEENSVYKNINIGNIKPYETKFVFLNEYVSLKEILKGKKGTVKLFHDFDGFFPRFIAGNFFKKEVVSITHTYYDNSWNIENDAYFENQLPDELYDSSVLIPVFLEKDFYNDLVYYPVYSPSKYNIDIIFYSDDGHKLGEIKKWKTIEDNESNFFTVNLNNLIPDAIKDKVTGIKIINNWMHKNKIPTRLKYGLNIGVNNKTYNLPTNICFAPQVANEKLLKKPGTFKWSPLLNNENTIVVITNSMMGDEIKSDTKIEITFYREEDDQFITRFIEVPANGQYRFELNKDKEIKDFLNNGNGWMTKQADKPFVNAWYFDISDSGIIAGDHSF